MELGERRQCVSTRVHRADDPKPADGGQVSSMNLGHHEIVVHHQDGILLGRRAHFVPRFAGTGAIPASSTVVSVDGATDSGTGTRNGNTAVKTAPSAY